MGIHVIAGLATYPRYSRVGMTFARPTELPRSTTTKERVTMQAIRISSRAASLGALAAAALLTASPAHAVPEGNGTNQGKGFETCSAPSTSTMQGWWTNTPWSWVGVYIGGAVRACSQPNLTSS